MVEANFKKRLAVPAVCQRGFTLIEVIVATVILSIVVVGTFAVYTHAVRVNTGNNLRAQALTVLQAEVEYFRGLRYVPSSTHPDLVADPVPIRPQRTSADGRVFNITVVVDNDPFNAGIQTGNESTCKFKEITITATPAIAETGWLSDLGTSLTVQRVRAN